MSDKHSRFALSVGRDQLEAPEIELERQHANYTPVTWWDCSLVEDQSSELLTKSGEALRLVGSQQPNFSSLSTVYGEDHVKLQSHLPALEYLARKARMNELLGSSLSEADTLTRLQHEQCYRGVAEMYMAICKTSQEAFLRSNKIEPGFLECLAEGIRTFCSADLVEEGMRHLEKFHSFVRHSKDEGAIVTYNLCKATLLITGHRYQEAIDLIEEAAETIRVLVGEDTPEYGNAMRTPPHAHMRAIPCERTPDNRCRNGGRGLFCNARLQGSPSLQRGRPVRVWIGGLHRHDMCICGTDCASFAEGAISYVWLRRPGVMRAYQGAADDIDERVAANPILANSIRRPTATFGDVLVRLAITKAGLLNHLNVSSKVAAAVSGEEVSFRPMQRSGKRLTAVG